MHYVVVFVFCFISLVSCGQNATSEAEESLSPVTAVSILEIIRGTLQEQLLSNDIHENEKSEVKASLKKLTELILKLNEVSQKYNPDALSLTLELPENSTSLKMKNIKYRKANSGKELKVDIKALEDLIVHLKHVARNNTSDDNKLELIENLDLLLINVLKNDLKLVGNDTKNPLTVNVEVFDKNPERQSSKQYLVPVEDSSDDSLPHDQGSLRKEEEGNEKAELQDNVDDLIKVIKIIMVDPRFNNQNSSGISGLPNNEDGLDEEIYVEPRANTQNYSRSSNGKSGLPDNLDGQVEIIINDLNERDRENLPYYSAGENTQSLLEIIINSLKRNDLHDSQNLPYDSSGENTRSKNTKLKELLEKLTRNISADQHQKYLDALSKILNKDKGKPKDPFDDLVDKEQDRIEQNVNPDQHKTVLNSNKEKIYNNYEDLLYKEWNALLQKKYLKEHGDININFADDSLAPIDYKGLKIVDQDLDPLFDSLVTNTLVNQKVQNGRSASYGPISDYHLLMGQKVIASIVLSVKLLLNDRSTVNSRNSVDLNFFSRILYENFLNIVRLFNDKDGFFETGDDHLLTESLPAIVSAAKDESVKYYKLLFTVHGNDNDLKRNEYRILYILLNAIGKYVQGYMLELRNKGVGINDFTVFEKTLIIFSEAIQKGLNSKNLSSKLHSKDEENYEIIVNELLNGILSAVKELIDHETENKPIVIPHSDDDPQDGLRKWLEKKLINILKILLDNTMNQRVNAHNAQQLEESIVNILELFIENINFKHLSTQITEQRVAELLAHIIGNIKSTIQDYNKKVLDQSRMIQEIFSMIMNAIENLFKEYHIYKYDSKEHSHEIHTVTINITIVTNTTYINETDVSPDSKLSFEKQLIELLETLLHQHSQKHEHSESDQLNLFFNAIMEVIKHLHQNSNIQDITDDDPLRDIRNLPYFNNDNELGTILIKAIEAIIKARLKHHEPYSGQKMVQSLINAFVQIISQLRNSNNSGGKYTLTALITEFIRTLIMSPDDHVPVIIDHPDGGNEMLDDYMEKLRKLIDSLNVQHRTTTETITTTARSYVEIMEIIRNDIISIFTDGDVNRAVDKLAFDFSYYFYILKLDSSIHYSTFGNQIVSIITQIIQSKSNTVTKLELQIILRNVINSLKNSIHDDKTNEFFRNIVSILEKLIPRENEQDLLQKILEIIRKLDIEINIPSYTDDVHTIEIIVKTIIDHILHKNSNNFDVIIIKIMRYLNEARKKIINMQDSNEKIKLLEEIYHIIDSLINHGTVPISIEDNRRLAPDTKKVIFQILDILYKILHVSYVPDSNIDNSEKAFTIIIQNIIEIIRQNKQRINFDKNIQMEELIKEILEIQIQFEGGGDTQWQLRILEELLSKIRGALKYIVPQNNNAILQNIYEIVLRLTGLDLDVKIESFDDLIQKLQALMHATYDAYTKNVIYKIIVKLEENSEIIKVSFDQETKLNELLNEIKLIIATFNNKPISTDDKTIFYEIIKLLQQLFDIDFSKYKNPKGVTDEKTLIDLVITIIREQNGNNGEIAKMLYDEILVALQKLQDLKYQNSSIVIDWKYLFKIISEFSEKHHSNYNDEWLRKIYETIVRYLDNQHLIHVDDIGYDIHTLDQLITRVVEITVGIQDERIKEEISLIIVKVVRTRNKIVDMGNIPSSILQELKILFSQITDLLNEKNPIFPTQLPDFELPIDIRGLLKTILEILGYNTYHGHEEENPLKFVITIIQTIINKFNTHNSGSQSELYNKLLDLLFKLEGKFSIGQFQPTDKDILLEIIEIIDKLKGHDNRDRNQWVIKIIALFNIIFPNEHFDINENINTLFEKFVQVVQKIVKVEQQEDRRKVLQFILTQLLNALEQLRGQDNLTTINGVQIELYATLREIIEKFKYLFNDVIPHIHTTEYPNSLERIIQSLIDQLKDRSRYGEIDINVILERLYEESIRKQEINVFNSTRNVELDKDLELTFLLKKPHVDIKFDVVKIVIPREALHCNTKFNDFGRSKKNVPKPLIGLLKSGELVDVNLVSKNSNKLDTDNVSPDGRSALPSDASSEDARKPPPYRNPDYGRSSDLEDLSEKARNSVSGKSGDPEQSLEIVNLVAPEEEAVNAEPRNGVNTGSLPDPYDPLEQGIVMND